MASPIDPEAQMLRSTQIMFGAQPMLKKDGLHTATVTGYTPTAAGCGSPIITGDGAHAITADGGGLIAGAGYGRPVLYLHPHG